MREFLVGLKAFVPALGRLKGALTRPELAAIRIADNKRLEAQKSAIERQMDNLTDLRIRDCLNDEEFNAKRAELQHEAVALTEKLRATASLEKMFEPVETLRKFCSRATFFFDRANRAQKRWLLEFLSSNRTIIDKRAILCPALS